MSLSDKHPLFVYGSGPDPLVIIAGGLIFDTGEAERTFFYRCQDRFLTYAALLGWQTLFFAASEDHVARYQKLIRDLAARFAEISEATGLFGMKTIKEPLFVLLDVETLAVRPSQRLTARLSEAALARSVSHGVALNQISPSYARFLASLDVMFSTLGIATNWPLAQAQTDAEQAMRLQDKAAYTEMVRQAKLAEARHLPTAIINEADLRGVPDWLALTAIFKAQTSTPATSGLFLKTNRNTSGNVSARFDSAGFSDSKDALLAALSRDAAIDRETLKQKAAELAAEVAANPALCDHAFAPDVLAELVKEQALMRRDLAFLLQPDLHRGPEKSRPIGLGVSYMITDTGAQRFGLNAQMYTDAARMHFLGPYFGPEVESFCDAGMLADCAALADHIARSGYRGPINFDLILDRAGCYRFVHDCNPRLTGIFPTLAVKWGIVGDDEVSVMSSGYRGEVVLPSLAPKLTTLQAAGLLLTRAQSRGVVLLPNLSAPQGYDLHVVGYPLEEALALLAPGGAITTALGQAVMRLKL
ncbi:hypothetical protein [Hoeflea poritis]|uniref:ATP-grasp domain-containing protein n=1 Tax=Hoeflea poritis TaxID=2993659 RepID=A0ABT4VKL5_9HYPH|nr:hypothetical protein [Hoeflea poritis]MDA4845234.1 hypothetical protein [Hoeflea poritis]